MSVYSLIYLLLAICMLIYTARSRLDLFSVASVCYIVYTIYCIPGIGISGFYRPKLSPALYCAVYIQMIMIMAFIAMTRKKGWRREGRTLLRMNTDAHVRKRNGSVNLRRSFRIYTAIIAAFALMNVLSVGLKGFMSGKSVVWEETNIFYIVSLYGAWPAFAYGIHNDDKPVWISSLLVEMTIFFAGSRAFITTLIIIFLCEKGTVLWQKRKDFMKIYILGALGIVFLLIYREIDTQIMAGDISGAMRILQNPATWARAFEFNEPRVIIANYDYAFTSGLRLPAGDVIYRIIDFVPGLTNLFRIGLKYPEYYSDWLMAQVRGSAGVGGSIWGESFSMMGWAGILLSTAIWLSFIKLCNRHLDYHKNYSYFLVAIGSYLAWYINRLDFNRVAQSCKVMFLCFLLWAVTHLIIGGSLQFKYISIRHS